jgi:hypothetical protein
MLIGAWCKFPRITREVLMARERRNHENLTARFPEGTLQRIERALRGREGKADFIRAAVAEKLARRERGGAANVNTEGDAQEEEGTG